MSVSDPAIRLALLPIPCAIGVVLQQRVVELEAMGNTVEINVGDAVSTETPQPLLELGRSESGARLIEHCKCGLSKKKPNEHQLLLLSQREHLRPLLLDVEASRPLRNQVQAGLVERRHTALIGYFLFAVC